jgi:DNA replication licensing factor MCM2
MQVNVTETVYRNYQKITLQESPGSVQAGRLPRHREVVLLHDLIDCARPGEEIQVTGDYPHWRTICDCSCPSARRS